MLLLPGCSDPGGLGTVSGLQGEISFETSWPDSLKAAVVVVFDVGLNLDSVSTPGYPVIEHFVTFGDPIDPGTVSTDYFIQLEPGNYVIMAIGLLLDPAILLANEALFERIGEFIVAPENAAPRGIVIREKKVNEQTRWYVRF
jgi:hypothetical protein